MKEVAYSRAALKSLKRMAPREANRVIEKVDQYAREPRSLANMVSRLAGSPYIRLRVGDWRVIMDDRGTVLEIVQIGNRREVYR